MEPITFDQQPGGAQPLVLIAEDAGIQVRLAQLCLERAGYRVVAARDGVEALEQIETERPDLILLDIDMPRANGFQVLDKVRSDLSTKSIPVIMLTAHAKDSTLFDEYAESRDVFMTKPYSPVRLIAEVQRIVASPPIQPALN